MVRSPLPSVPLVSLPPKAPMFKVSAPGVAALSVVDEWVLLPETVSVPVPEMPSGLAPLMAPPRFNALALAKAIARVFVAAIGAVIDCAPLFTPIAAAATPLLRVSVPGPVMLNEVVDESSSKIMPLAVLPPPSTATVVAAAPVKLPPLNRTVVPTALGEEPPTQFPPNDHELLEFPFQLTVVALP